MFCRAAAVLAAALALGGCQKKEEGPPPRYAFARFENLTGDASLDWVARAASEVLIRSLEHAMPGPVLNDSALNRAGGAGISGDRVKANLAGANHLVSGYLERVGGKLRLYATDEDLITRRETRSVSAEGVQPLAALEGLARAISDKAGPMPTKSEAALRFYATGLESGSSGPLLENMRAATEADPAFGAAWVGLLDGTSLTGDRARIQEVAAEALAHKLGAYDSAVIRMQKAAFADDKAGRLAAMREVSALTPADLALVKALAENEVVAGEYGRAAAAWKKLQMEVPTDKEAWNQLGYALAWSGDLAGAVEDLKGYESRWPADPNPSDSLGDVYYMYGKFGEAAAQYLKAQQRGAQLLNGGDLYKAAWAQFRAGDKAKADATFEQFREARKNGGGFELLEADWLYRTGRRTEAVAFARKAVVGVQPAAAAALWAEMVVWDLLAKDRAAAARDSAVAAGLPNSSAVLMARFAAQSSAPAGEWAARAAQSIRAPENVRRFALAIALTLDGKREAALPLWTAIAADSPGTDFFTRAVALRAKGEKPKLELVPDPLGVNQFAALADGF